MAQVSRPILIFVPAELLEAVKGKRNADAMAYLAHYLLMMPAKNKRIHEKYGDYLPLNKQKLNKLLNCNIDSCIKTLLNYELLDCDNQYIPNKKSYHYRIHPKHIHSIAPYEITKDSPLYSKLIKKHRNRKANYNLLPEHLRAMQKHFDKLSFDLDGALKWIADNATEPRKKITYTITAYMMADKRQRFFKRNQTNGRLDTNITNMKSELRRFIAGDFVQIDLKNSQPFFLMAFLKILANFFNTHSIDYELLTTGIPLCSNLDSLDLVKSFGTQSIKEVSKIHKKHDLSKIMNYWSADFNKFSQWVTDGILYDKFVKEYGNGITRTEVKKTMFAVLFSQNEYYQGYNRIVPYEKEKKVFASVFPTVAQVVELLKTKEHNQLAIWLQKMESYTFIDCITKELFESGITPITIHDSVLVSPQQKDKALTIIENVFSREFGIIPPFSIEPLRPKLSAREYDLSNDNRELIPTYQNGIITPKMEQGKAKRARIKYRLVYSTAI